MSTRLSYDIVCGKVMVEGRTPQPMPARGVAVAVLLGPLVQRREEDVGQTQVSATEEN